MASESISPLKGNKGGLLDAVIERGIILLLIFTPLAIGTVQQWSIAIMEIVAFIVFGAWLMKAQGAKRIEQGAEGREQGAKPLLLIFIGSLILITILQIIPLSEQLLSLISPSSSSVYKTFTNDAAGSWRTISIYPDATRGELFKLLSYAAIFLVIINHYRTRAQVYGIIHTVIYIGCFLVIFAIIQKMTWNGRLFWFYPLRQNLNSDMAYIWGPYINHNHFAGYLEMAIPLAMGFLLYKASNIKSLPGIPLSKKIANFSDSGSIVPMVFLSLSVLIMSGGLFISLSRGGIIGFTVSMVFFTGITRTRRSLRKKAGVFALLGILIFFGVVMTSWSRIEDRFQEIGKEGRIMRIYVWRDTANIIKDFPAFGTGLGTFRSIYPQYQTKYSQFLFEHAENDYIEILTDTGFAGFTVVISMVIVFFCAVIKAWRRRHNIFVKCMVAGGLSSCVAIAAHSFTDFNMRIPANALLLTVIAALTYAAVYNVREKKAHESN
ncbi:MAG: O-antigen ligase family protein [Nitrospirae bacterium]|nr:O-antigen ligase family protein [Nitrospirota bacterium]